jgi:hypothetical protein
MLLRKQNLGSCSSGPCSCERSVIVHRLLPTRTHVRAGFRDRIGSWDLPIPSVTAQDQVFFKRRLFRDGRHERHHHCRCEIAVDAHHAMANTHNRPQEMGRLSHREGKDSACTTRALSLATARSTPPKKASVNSHSTPQRIWTFLDVDSQVRFVRGPRPPIRIQDRRRRGTHPTR